MLRGALGPSMALALRAACGCANWLSCQFVEHRVLTGPLPTNKSKRGLDFHPSPFCFYLAVREGFEPSIRFLVYTLSRRAPSATQTPHRVRYSASVATGRYYRETAARGQENFRRFVSGAQSLFSGNISRAAGFLERPKQKRS